MKFIFTLSLLILLTACKEGAQEAPLDQAEWEELSIPARNNSHLGRLKASNGALYFSWVESNDRMDSLFYSSFKDAAWKDRFRIAYAGDWFVNWADFPAIAANGDRVLTNLLVKSDTGTYTYDVQLQLLQKNSLIKPPFILHDDGTKSEHGFVSMLPWEDGFFATWLDGRNTGGGHHGHEDHGGAGAMTLRGAFIGPDGAITGDTELDARICDCCQTAATLTSSGIVVAYRDRTQEEIRDISIVRYTEETGWSEPVDVSQDHWNIAGCPVNGPSLSSWNDQVALAWFSAAQGEGKVFLKTSMDGGISFGDSVRLDDGLAYGRVDVQWVDANRVAVLWMEPQGEADVLRIKILQTDGTVLLEQDISTMDASRASGFPQLELFEDHLYVCWTDVGQEGKGAQIRMKRLFIGQ